MLKVERLLLSLLRAEVRAMLIVRTDEISGVVTFVAEQGYEG